MIWKLLALFTIVPLVELALLIVLATYTSAWVSIGLVILTAIIGAVLGKMQGARALARIKSELNQGKIPGDSLLDGLAVLIAGVFMITPGVLTDIAAIFLLIPPARRPLRAIAKKRFTKMLATDSVTFVSAESAYESYGSDGGARPFHSPFGGPPPGTGDIIDVTPDGDGASEQADEETYEKEHITG